MHLSPTSKLGYLSLTPQFFFFSGYRWADGPLSGSQSAVYLRMYRSGDASVGQLVQREVYPSSAKRNGTVTLCYVSHSPLKRPGQIY